MLLWGSWALGSIATFLFLMRAPQARNPTLKDSVEHVLFSVGWPVVWTLAVVIVIAQELARMKR